MNSTLGSVVPLAMFNYQAHHHIAINSHLGNLGARGCDHLLTVLGDNGVLMKIDHSLANLRILMWAIHFVWW